MTSEEYRLLDNHVYSFYTGNMGKVFNDWHDKKIDGTTAVQKMKRWYNKGLEKIVHEKYADIQKQELKRNFDSLVSFIRDYDLVDEDESLEKHYLMTRLEEEAPTAFEAIKKAIAIGIVEYDNKFLNFKCSKGSVGLIFSQGGFIEIKAINQHILINGKPPEKSTLKNGRNNTPPKDWPNIEKQLFP